MGPFRFWWRWHQIKPQYLVSLRSREWHPCLRRGIRNEAAVELACFHPRTSWRSNVLFLF
jgi:hypothetical protein